MLPSYSKTGVTVGIAPDVQTPELLFLSKPIPMSGLPNIKLPSRQRVVSCRMTWFPLVTENILPNSGASNP